MANAKISQLVLALSLTAAAAVQADHNSIWGEGWANMSNDIHNTRIDTMDADDDDFIDFVRMGSGADSDNRFLADSTDITGGSVDGAGQGGARGGRR